MIKKPGRTLRKNSIRYKIGSIMILAVILLTLTCYLLYRNLSSIVSSIRIDEKPELRLMSIRNISLNMEKAGNSVRIYTVTKNASDIRPYYVIISNIDDDVNRLRAECNNDSVLLAQTNTISSLIEENILIWNQLLALNKDDKVMENLRLLSEQLDSVSATTKKQGILRRVFSKSPETPPLEKEIAADLNVIVEENLAKREELATRELQLAKNSSEITGKLYDLITKMEMEIYEQIQSKAEAAGALADKTYMWLVILMISGGVLALIVIYIIIKYSKNAYAYQIALENARVEAENLAKTKELFIANMSHEIRTPVTAISGFTEQLLHEQENEESAESLRIIKSSSDHLLKVIDDILDFSKLQNNMIVPERIHFSISRIMQDVHAMFERQAGLNNTRLSWSLNPDTPEALVGDPYRLKQIMINLVSNSVKFTKNGMVHFGVTNGEMSPGKIDLIIEFTDTGIGIDESKLEEVFEDFRQAEMNTTRKYGGTGLGLSIVKKLTELLGGSIELKSKKNQGTRITCIIPFGLGDKNKVADDTYNITPVPDEIAGLKIMVVDDEEYNRLLFKKILDRWKTECHLVENGMDALELLKEKKFDLLFMDMRMPGIDGLKATRFIREEMKISESELPVIFISAAPGIEDLKSLKEAGVSEFLQKPFTEIMLLNAITRVISGKKESSEGLTAGNDQKITGSPQGIDLKNLYRISGNDEQFVKQMLISFIDTTEKGISDLQKAINNRDPGTAADISHKIQPPCRHIGALELHGILARIEKAARTEIETSELEIMAKQALAQFVVIKQLVNTHIEKLT